MDHNNSQKQPINRLKFIIPIIVIIATLTVFLFVKSNDSIEKSSVNGMSDEVYEQLVQWYFFNLTIKEMLLGDKDMDPAWKENHELATETNKYVENSKYDNPWPGVFPNALLNEALDQSADYTKTEEEYIEKMYEFLFSLHTVDEDTFERLEKELKEEMLIKDSYNPFD